MMREVSTIRFMTGRGAAGRRPCVHTRSEPQVSDSSRHRAASDNRRRASIPRRPAGAPHRSVRPVSRDRLVQIEIRQPPACVVFGKGQYDWEAPGYSRKALLKLLFTKGAATASRLISVLFRRRRSEQHQTTASFKNRRSVLEVTRPSSLAFAVSLRTSRSTSPCSSRRAASWSISLPCRRV